MSNQTKVILKSLLVMMLWGSLFPMVKLGYRVLGIGSNTVSQILLFAGLRFTVCGAIITFFAMTRKGDTRQNVKKSLVPILLTGLFSIILHYACTYISLSLVDSSKTAILKQLGALFYICFGFVFFKDEKFSLVKIIGALIGFTGIIVINFNEKSLQFSISDLLIVIASICTVAGSLTSKRAMVNTSAIMTTGVSQFFGGIVFVVVALCMGAGGLQFTWGAIPVLLYICAASIVSYCLWNDIIRTNTLSKMFLIKFTEPIFACIFSAILIGENILNWRYLLSFLLIASGITLGNTKFKQLNPVDK